VSERDKARNTAQAAEGKARQAAGNPYARLRRRGKEEGQLKRAGEKLKDTAGK
jgi:hypothetical protein